MNETGNESEKHSSRESSTDTRMVDRLTAIDSEAQRIWASKIIGRTIGPFQVLEEIGSDDTCAIFKALEVKKNRIVCFKVLWFKIAANETAFARFVRAMRTMIDFEHPNLVQLYAAGKEDEFCYMATEFLEARTLSKLSKQDGNQGMLDWHTILRVGHDISKALQLAFEKKILHRNINPNNILVTSEGTAKLDNLILAKAIEGVQVEHITQDSKEIIGEMMYLAPEALLSDERMDCRSDIYSLGATLYHALTGQPPFEASNAASLGKMILIDSPQPPREFQPLIPDRFEEAILRMLAKKPEQRFSDPRELSDFLDSLEN